jgi:hypothetical protein
MTIVTLKDVKIAPVTILHSIVLFEASSAVYFKVKVKVRSRHLSVSSILNFMLMWIDVM